jgi:hypothetical protein
MVSVVEEIVKRNVKWSGHLIRMINEGKKSIYSKLYLRGEEEGKGRERNKNNR